MPPALIGDIGATNARFALLENGKPQAVKVLHVDDFPTLRAAIDSYLADAAPSAAPRRAALAVAGPVTGDRFSLTNNHWSFSIEELKGGLGLDRLELVNDFAALALAAPRFGPQDRRQVGDGNAVSDAPIAVIGPGTGLGVASVVPARCDGKTRWVPLPGEGGHATLPTVGEREMAIVEFLYGSGYDHVSAERLVCGEGLVNLCRAIAALDGKRSEDLTPPDVTDRAAHGDAVAHEAVAIFCAMLGTVAGNLALTVGARGGVYVAGGIVPKLGQIFDRSDFRRRFVSKGRMQRYVETIPTFVVTNELPAFIGLAAALEA